MQMPWEISDKTSTEIIGLKKRDISTNRGNGRLRRFVGRTCPYCMEVMTRSVGWHSSIAPSRDHRVPTSRGGMNVESNIVICCRGCNELKGSLDEEEFAEWKAGRLSRLDDGWWSRMRQRNPHIPRYPYIHYARQRLRFHRY